MTKRIMKINSVPVVKSCCASRRPREEQVTPHYRVLDGPPHLHEHRYPWPADNTSGSVGESCSRDRGCNVVGRESGKGKYPVGISDGMDGS